METATAATLPIARRYWLRATTASTGPKRSAALLLLLDVGCSLRQHFVLSVNLFLTSIKKAILCMFLSSFAAIRQWRENRQTAVGRLPLHTTNQNHLPGDVAKTWKKRRKRRKSHIGTSPTPSLKVEVLLTRTYKVAQKMRGLLPHLLYKG